MISLLPRLLLIMTVAMVPGLLFQVYSEHEARHLRQQLQENEARRLLQVVISQGQRITEAAEQVLDMMSNAPGVQDHAPALCRGLLSNLLKDWPRYEDAELTSTDGTPLCIRVPASRTDVADRPWFRQALQTGVFVIGNYETARRYGEPTLRLAKPFKNRSGTVSGVAHVALSLRWLGEQLEHLDLSPDSTVSIADRNGIVLASRPDNSRLIGQKQHPDSSDLNDEDRIRGIGSMTSPDNGQPLLVALSPPVATPKGFMVTVTLNEQTSFAAATWNNLMGLAALITGAILALVLTAWVGSRLIRRPVNRLLTAAEQWRGGDFANRCGQVAGISEFGRLATAFDDMAETLQARERALHVALESTTDIVLVIDRDWRLAYLNARARAAGVAPVGLALWEAYPTLLGTPFEQSYRTAMESGIATKIEAYYPLYEGYFEANAFPSVDGLTIFVRDLTEERRTSAALRESESRLQLAREAVGFGVWDRDFVNDTLVWSEEQWRLHGLAPRPGGPGDREWIATIHPEDRDRIVAAGPIAITHPSSPLDTEYRVIWPGGVVHWLQAKAHATWDTSGTIVRVVGLTLDITSSRENEAALRRLSAKLEERVREEVAAREAAQERSAQAERLHALGQLAGGIAHDINNVLQAVGGAITLIERRSGDKAAISRYTRIASDAIERGVSVTRRLLTFSRRGDLRTETLDVAALIRGLHEILAYTLGVGTDMCILLPDDLPLTSADKGQLETVIVNLATNARDAMPHGGQLLISARPETVFAHDLPHPAGLDVGNYIQIAVTDTGTGMDALTLVRAREPFFTTKEPGAGTGLGMPMASGFAEQSGGALTIDSGLGEGTTVTLWLPQATAEPIASAAKLPCDAIASLPARILVVDDEATIREILAQHLEHAGYSVLLASDGTEALDLLRTGTTVDAVVTDLSMPGIDGIAVIQAMQNRLPNAPVILLTGYAEDAASLALSGAVAGSVSLLRKPVSNVQLLDCLGTMLAKRVLLAS